MIDHIVSGTTDEPEKSCYVKLPWFILKKKESLCIVYVPSLREFRPAKFVGSFQFNITENSTHPLPSCRAWLKVLYNSIR